MCVYAYLFVYVICTFRVKKRVLDALKLELQFVLSCASWVLGIYLRSSLQKQYAFFTDMSLSRLLHLEKQIIHPYLAVYVHVCCKPYKMMFFFCETFLSVIWNFINLHIFQNRFYLIFHYESLNVKWHRLNRLSDQHLNMSWCWASPIMLLLLWISKVHTHRDRYRNAWIKAVMQESSWFY